MIKGLENEEIRVLVTLFLLETFNQKSSRTVGTIAQSCRIPGKLKAIELTDKLCDQKFLVESKKMNYKAYYLSPKVVAYIEENLDKILKEHTIRLVLKDDNR